MGIKKFLPLCAVLPLLAACGQDLNLVSAVLGDGASAHNPKYLRLTAATFHIENYAPFKDKISYFDVGVKENLGDSATCEILSPLQNTRAAKQPWAPVDFYANVLDEKERQEEKDRIGEPNIFFQGDDNNRNNGQSSFRDTLRPDPEFSESLDFRDVRRAGANWVQTLLKFTRGQIQYEGMLAIRTYPTDRGCTTKAYICTHTSQTTNAPKECAAGGWDREIRKVSVVIDKKGALYDKLWNVTNEKEKNDVGSLVGLVVDLDEDGNPVGDPYKLVLAQKEE